MAVKIVRSKKTPVQGEEAGEGKKPFTYVQRSVTGKQVTGNNSKVVAGIDPSTQTGMVVMGTGAVVLNEEINVSGLPVVTPAQRIYRALMLGQQVYEKLVQFKPTVAVVEGYGYGNPNSLATLVELGTSVRFACYKAGVPFVEVAPTSLKKFITGDGNSKKDELMMKVLKRWGFESKTNNIADAYGLARIGLCYSGLVPMENMYERELVGGLKNYK